MKGFTVIEIAIVVVILAVLTAMAITSFSGFRQNQLLNSDVNKAVSIINEARSKTLSSQDFSQYGVHFETTKLALFKGATYVASSPDNASSTLSSFIEISEISLAGEGSDVIFQKLTGKTDQSGAITFRVKADTSKTKTINISSTGITNVQ
ncbi:MAG: prepilin-type N-terminal cleavage/methylation domain-containing protein [Candidatus Paceibacterota bacterium]